MPAFIAGGAILGGALISRAGGAMQGAATNRAGRQARDRFALETSIDKNRLGYSVYGDPYNDLIIAGDYKNYSDAQRQAALDRFMSSTGGSVLDQQRGLAADYGNVVKGQMERFDRRTGELEAKSGKAQGDLSSLYEGDLGPMASTISRGYGGLDASFADYIRQLDGQLSKWGAGRGAQIDSDFAKAQKDADDVTRATLGSSGFAGGGGVMGAQLAAGNAAKFASEKSRAKQDLSDAQIDKRAGYGTQLFGQRAAAQERGVQTGVANQASILAGRRDAVGNMIGQGVQRAYGREVERAGQEDAQVSRAIQLRQAPAATLYATQTSPVMNQWLNANTSQYYPGASGAANAMGTVGNTASLLGSYGLAQQLYGQPGAAGAQNAQLRSIWG